MHKTEGMVKYPIVFLKPIRMHYELTVVVFTISLQAWPRKKCVPVPLNIMDYPPGNVCYIILTSAKVLSYPVRRQIKIQQTRVQQ